MIVWGEHTTGQAGGQPWLDPPQLTAANSSVARPSRARRASRS